MRSKEKELLHKQVDVFLSHPHYIGEYGTWLRWYVDVSNYVSIFDMVLDDDAEEKERLYFEMRCAEEIKSHFERDRALKAFDSFCRFYTARARTANTREKMGRPPHLSEIKKAQAYRKKGLKLKEIAALMDKQVTVIHRWVNYDIDK